MALLITKHPAVVLELRRSKADSVNKLVYVLTANKKVKYPSPGGSKGRHSSIVYVGTTKKGAKRITSSVAARAWLLGEYGIRSLQVRVVTCKCVPGVSTWTKLERAILIVFKEMFGSLPKGNQKGHKLRVRDEFKKKYFKRDRIVSLITSFDE